MRPHDCWHFTVRSGGCFHFTVRSGRQRRAPARQLTAPSASAQHPAAPSTQRPVSITCTASHPAPAVPDAGAGAVSWLWRHAGAGCWVLGAGAGAVSWLEGAGLDRVPAPVLWLRRWWAPSASTSNLSPPRAQPVTAPAPAPAPGAQHQHRRQQPVSTKRAASSQHQHQHRHPAQAPATCLHHVHSQLTAPVRRT